MFLFLLVVVQDTITLPTEITTIVTQNQCLCLSIIVVITKGLTVKTGACESFVSRDVVL